MKKPANLNSKQLRKSGLLSAKDRKVFQQESIDLFKHRRQGHFIHRMYMTEEALSHWSEFMKHPGYYITRNEKNLISGFAHVIGDMAKHPDGIIGIENGPGTVSAMQAKSVPFFSAMPDIHTYIGRDWSPAIVGSVEDVMQTALPRAKIIPSLSNFLKDMIPPTASLGRRVMAEFGITRGNMEGFANDPFPSFVFLSDMAFHREQLHPGDLYVLSFDANQDEKSIHDAYNSPWLTKWGQELFWLMKRELSITGDFDPESFVFHPIWYAASHINTNNMVATRDMVFSIGGTDIEVRKGEAFGITNSYKIPVPLFTKIASQAGFEAVHFFQDAEKRMTLAVLRAV